MPSSGAFDTSGSLSQEDTVFMNQWGFNLVRLGGHIVTVRVAEALVDGLCSIAADDRARSCTVGVMWPGVEPERGQYNFTYLQAISDMVNMLGKAGIYTLLDFHQVSRGRYTCSLLCVHH